jgi:hypothetical protein
MAALLLEAVGADVARHHQAAPDVDPAARRVRPSGKPTSEATIEPLTESIAVRRQRTCPGACTIEGAGGYRVTAAATAVLADALIATSSDRPGCFDPQELFILEDLQTELRTSGADVVRQTGTDVRANPFLGDRSLAPATIAFGAKRSRRR